MLGNIMSIKKEENVEFSSETIFSNIKTEPIVATVKKETKTNNEASLIQNIKMEPDSEEKNSPLLKIRKLSGDRLSNRKNSLNHETQPNFNLINRVPNTHHNQIAAEIKLNRGRFLRPLTCSVCASNFYVFDFYMYHLRIEHKLQYERCRFCLELYPLDKLFSHFSTHNIGIYECLYCSFGTNNFRRIVMHLWREHPSKTPHIVLRLSKRIEWNLSEPDVNDPSSTVIALIGMQEILESLNNRQILSISSRAITNSPRKMQEAAMIETETVNTEDMETDTKDQCIPEAREGDIHEEDSQHAFDSKENPSSYVFVCYYCSETFQNLDTLKIHWIECHRMKKYSRGTPYKPFLFKVNKIYRCYFCDKSGSTVVLAVHINQAHRDQNVHNAFTEMNNINQCAFCSFKTLPHNREMLLQHFAAFHMFSRPGRNAFLNDEFLESITKFQVTFLKCKQCSYEGNIVPEDMDIHFRTCHKGIQKVDYEEYKKNNEISYQCYCTLKFKNDKTLATHLRVRHGIRVDRQTSAADSHKLQKLAIIFSNGFIMDRSEMMNTQYSKLFQNLKE